MASLTAVSKKDIANGNSHHELNYNFDKDKKAVSLSVNPSDEKGVDAFYLGGNTPQQSGDPLKRISPLGYLMQIIEHFFKQA